MDATKNNPQSDAFLTIFASFYAIEIKKKIDLHKDASY